MFKSHSCIILAVSVFLCQSIMAAQADETPATKTRPQSCDSLAFKAAGPGLFDFNTGKLSGRLKLDGTYQGVASIVDVSSGRLLTKPPGVFSFYRVFSTNRRFGNAARDWPTKCRLLADGAVEVHWPAAEEHPLEMTAVYRWSSPNTLDLQTTVKPQQDMPCFEVFLSSYFTDDFRASIYMKPDANAQSSFVAADPGPNNKGAYAMFPLDASAAAMVSDGRWSIPPAPVAWDIQRWMAAPLGYRRDTSAGITAAMMARPQDCFALSCRWNVAKNVATYRSLYLSLFGKDLQAGQTATTNCRLLIGANLSDKSVVDHYNEYIKSFPSENPSD